jgi:hypothetical protein
MVWATSSTLAEVAVTKPLLVLRTTRPKNSATFSYLAAPLVKLGGAGPRALFGVNSGFNQLKFMDFSRKEAKLPAQTRCR